jgi:hypothetical protein
MPAPSITEQTTSFAKKLQPGHILAVRTPSGIFGADWWIRLQAAIQNKPSLSNHIAVFHHWDAHGVPQCIEARPGGTGWRDAREYLQSPYTVTNAGQVLTARQSSAIASAAEALLKTDYDWQAIIDDGFRTFGIGIPGWNPTFTSNTGILVQPTHVDCSALAAYAYYKAHAQAPKPLRTVTPDDWVDFIIRREWEVMASAL